MIPTTSQNYTEIVQDVDRNFLAKLFLGSTELSCDIKKIQITKGSCGTVEGFNVGAIISSTLTAEVLSLNTDVKNQDISAQIGLLIDGNYEYITVGHFTVSEVKKTIYSTTITAYGFSTSKTGGSFTSPQDKTPPEELTLQNIANEIAAETGCTVTFDAGIVTSATLTLAMSGLTTYQALQAVTQAVGGYAVDTYDGNIAIKKYDSTTTLRVHTGMMIQLPQLEEEDFEITGVLCNTPGGAIGSQTPINLVTDSYWVNADMFDDYEANIVGYTYRPASVSLTLGDPRIEGYDVLEVVNADGTTSVVPCHSVVHTYTGGLSTQIIAAKATPINNAIATPKPISQQIEGLQQQIRDIEQNESVYFWHTTTDTGAGAGSHITQIPQADFLADVEQGGGNVLIDDSGMTIREGITPVAQFTRDEAVVGESSKQRMTITAEGMTGYNSDSVPFFKVDYDGGEVTTIPSDVQLWSDVAERREISYNTNAINILTRRSASFAGQEGNTFTLSREGGVLRVDCSCGVPCDSATTSYDSSELNVVVSGDKSGFSVSLAEEELTFDPATLESFTRSATVTLTRRITSPSTVYVNFRFGVSISYDNVSKTFNVSVSPRYTTNPVLSARGNAVMRLYSATAAGDPVTTNAPTFTLGTRATDQAGGWSIGAGFNVDALGNGTQAFGLGTIANKEGQMSVGMYNEIDEDPQSTAHALFTVGNGLDSSNRSNAFSVDKSGDISVFLDTSTTTGTDKDIYDSLVELGWTDCIE